MQLVLIKFSQLVKTLEIAKRIPFASYADERREASGEWRFSRDFYGEFVAAKYVRNRHAFV